MFNGFLSCPAGRWVHSQQAFQKIEALVVDSVFQRLSRKREALSVGIL